MAEVGREAPVQVIEGFLALPLDRQMLALRTVVPRVLSRLSREAFAGFLRDLLSEVALEMKVGAKSQAPSGRPSRPLRRDRRVRSDAHELQTEALFLKQLRERIGIETNEEAERITSAVLCALGRRLAGGEMEDLYAQMPRRLHRTRCLNPDHIPGKKLRPRDIDWSRLVALVGEELEEPDRGRVESYVRGVFWVVRDWATEGELENVSAQLPANIRSAWEQPVELFAP